MGSYLFTAPAVLSIAGGILLVAAIIEFIFSVAFCTRPAPAWVRQARTLGLGLAGARLLTRDNASIDIDAWFVTGLWLYLAITQAIVAGYTVTAVLPPKSDFCRRGENGKAKIVRTALLIAFGALLMAATVNAQEAGTENASKPAVEDNNIDVVVGDFSYPLNADEPIQGCVIGVEQNQDGETTLTYRLFVREQASDGPIFNSVGVYTDSSKGFPADIEINDCVGV